MVHSWGAGRYLLTKLRTSVCRTLDVHHSCGSSFAQIDISPRTKLAIVVHALREAVLDISAWMTRLCLSMQSSEGIQ